MTPKILKTPDNEVKRDTDNDDDLKAAEDALSNARNMPRGPERILALKQAGQMRYDAEQRRLVTDASSETPDNKRRPFLNRSK